MREFDPPRSEQVNMGLVYRMKQAYFESQGVTLTVLDQGVGGLVVEETIDEILERLTKLETGK